MSKLAIEIKGSFLGQEIPSWLRVFDCRTPASDPPILAPWTCTFNNKTFSPSLFGSEPASVDLGLRAKGIHEDIVPIGGSGYGDTRRNEAEALSATRAMFYAAAACKRDWDKASAKPMSDNGGSIYYQPIAVALCNYGWSVICDRRDYRVVEFT